MAKKPKTNGRPNLYATRIEPYLDIIADLRAKGKTDAFIADMLGVTRKTFFTHKSKVDDFLHVYEKAEDVMLTNIENSLFELALGKAVKRTIITKTDSMGRVINKVERVEQLPPDTTAAFFVLTNRRGDDWKHKQEVVNPSVDETLEAIKELSDKLDETEWNHT